MTDRTVEVAQGDWVRGSSGALAISRKVLHFSKGGFGPFVACVGGGRLIWCDPVGIHVMGQGNDQRDVTATISWPVHPFVSERRRHAGHERLSCAFNHASQDVWVCMTQAQPATDTKNRVTLVYSMTSGRWTVFDHSLSWVCRVNDGQFGQQFYGCDYYGNLLELDVLDGDGIEGNESWFSAGGMSITSISGLKAEARKR